MKTTYSKVIIALITVAALSASSCKKTLTEQNLGGITPDAVYTTPAGFESLVNAAYSYTRWWYGKEYGISLSEMGTDIWTSGTGDVYPELTNYTSNLQANQAAVGIEWKQFYTAINLCNAGISRIGNSGMTAALQKTREGELRFLRAFYYWHIVETWGGVHLTTTETAGVAITANRTSVDKFYEQIIADLKVAVTNLPTTTTDYGRITQGGAKAFLARIYLTRNMNQEAASLSADVIKNYGYQLQTNYADLWKMDNLQNKEIVWSIHYSANLTLNDRLDALLYPTGHPNGGNNSHLLFVMKYDNLPGLARDINNGRPYNRYMPTLFLLNLFNETIDARYEGSFKMAYYCNTTTAPAGIAIGDTAVYCTKNIVSAAVRATKKYQIYDRNDVYNANSTAKNRLQYVALKKFMDPTRASANEEQSARDVYVIRLAEEYLNAAEAYYKLGKLDSAAYYVNVIRTRAALAGKVDAMKVTASQMTLDFILDERAREFAGEQIRWFDLKRTGKLVERVQKNNPDAASNIQTYQLLRPIPQAQIDAVQNKTEFTQNPGYQ
ncbi:MAG: RagB/SusD family nutrient uptake outer membrane protein [Janthinobacterium lividum]